MSFVRRLWTPSITQWLARAEGTRDSSVFEQDTSMREILSLWNTQYSAWLGFEKPRGSYARPHLIQASHIPRKVSRTGFDTLLRPEMLAWAVALLTGTNCATLG